ncbi:GreA/GreB family elongation factor [Kitasatospora sp. NPDC056531]|uniref:GreA/GreB family elongation factor n=1 Tax=Kitasatospora sp. NPDC056531 TaxID=3345856 RepID=UPI0036884C47
MPARRPRTRADQVRRERDRHADLEARAAVLKAYLTGDRTSPADVVSPGRAVTRSFDDEDEEQEFEITSGEPFDEGTTQLSPFTALGKALAGRSTGITVTCGENGRRLAVHIRDIRA